MWFIHNLDFSAAIKIGIFERMINMGWDNYDHYNNDYNQNGIEPPRPSGRKTIFERAEDFFWRHGKAPFFIGSYIVLTALMIVLVAFLGSGQGNVLWSLFRANLFMLVGLYSLFFPYAAWKGHRLYVRGGEPTNFYYGSTFVLSIFMIVLSFILAFAPPEVSFLREFFTRL